MIEVLIAVAIIGIIAAMAIPGLLRARMAGNEASAVGSLRTVSAGQTGFAASCGGGFFAPSLAVLSAPPTVIGGEGFVSNDLSADPSTKSSYSIAVTPGMSRELLKLSGSLVHDYATISDDSPSPNRASRARRAATSASIS